MSLYKTRFVRTCSDLIEVIPLSLKLKLGIKKEKRNLSEDILCLSGYFSLKISSVTGFSIMP